MNVREYDKKDKKKKLDSEGHELNSIKFLTNCVFRAVT